MNNTHIRLKEGFNKTPKEPTLFVALVFSTLAPSPHVPDPQPPASTATRGSSATLATTFTVIAARGSTPTTLPGVPPWAPMLVTTTVRCWNHGGP